MGLFSKILKKEEGKKREEVVKVPVSKKEAVPKTEVLAKAGFGILIEPHVTEKSVKNGEGGVYVFKIADGATKEAVKSAVEKKFSVPVRGVRILNMPGKARRVGRRTGFRKGYRKAVVTLIEGKTIDLGV